MYCTHCGLELKQADRFCSQCGKGTGHGEPKQEQGYYAPRRVFRLMYDKKLGGVCSGVAKYLDIDVTLIRIITLCLVPVTGGMVIVGYIVAWIVMPPDYGAHRREQASYAGEQAQASGQV